MTVFVVDYLVVSQDIGIDGAGLVHISHAYHTAYHSAKLLTLVQKQVVILYGLEPVALKVGDVECLLAVGTGYNGAYLVPTLAGELVGALHVAAFYLGAEYAQVTHLDLEIHGFGLALRVLPDLESAAALQVDCDGCVTLAGVSAGVGEHALGYGIILKHADINTEHFYEPFP